jgi:hypothetical protein
VAFNIGIDIVLRRHPMHAHFVLAHPEPQSFNAHLVRSGSSALADTG